MLTQTQFKPAWWLKNAHLQTIYPALFRKTTRHPSWHRERLSTPDGDFLDIDWCGHGSQPLVILLHGLTGSSKSGYICGLQHVLLSQGFRSVTVNFRGCSGESNHLARCYHSGETEDIGFVYQTLRQREPNTPFAALGFSLGGNVLLKWLGEQGDKLDLFAAIAVSVPLVLSICATKLDNGFAKIYRANLLRELKQYISLKQRHLQQLGHHAEAKKLATVGDLTKIDSFWQYDEQVVARLHGFNDVHHYYQHASSRQYLKSITVPSLIIHAVDDPFMTPAVIPTENELSPHVQLELAQRGGHVGFIAGRIPLKPVYWLEQRIPAFLHERHIPT